MQKKDDKVARWLKTAYEEERQRKKREQERKMEIDSQINPNFGLQADWLHVQIQLNKLFYYSWLVGKT